MSEKPERRGISQSRFVADGRSRTCIGIIQKILSPLRLSIPQFNQFEQTLVWGTSGRGSDIVKASQKILKCNDPQLDYFVGGKEQLICNLNPECFKISGPHPLLLPPIQCGLGRTRYRTCRDILLRKMIWGMPDDRTGRSRQPR